jgi:hypothetical protein
MKSLGNQLPSAFIEQFIELSPAWIWQGNCFMGIESTFYNSLVAASGDRMPGCGTTTAWQLPCQLISRAGRSALPEA